MMTGFCDRNGQLLGVMLATIGCAVPSSAARAPRIPADAPACAGPGQPAIFLSPMGEPFRAPAGSTYPAAAWFAQADANHDGVIDRAEMAADAIRFFATLDRDHNGRLTPDEVNAYERDVAPEIAIYQDRTALPRSRSTENLPTDDRRTSTRTAPARPAAGRNSYGGAMGAGRYAWLNIPQPVASADADVNRAIDEREFADAASRRFGMLDRGGAGRLKLADLPMTPAQQAIVGPCRPLPSPRERASR